MDKKQGPTEMQAEVARLQGEGKLPPLHEVLGAVAETRSKYRGKILDARKSGEEKEE